MRKRNKDGENADSDEDEGEDLKFPEMGDRVRGQLGDGDDGSADLMLRGRVKRRWKICGVLVRWERWGGSRSFFQKFFVFFGFEKFGGSGEGLAGALFDPVKQERPESGDHMVDFYCPENE